MDGIIEIALDYWHFVKAMEDMPMGVSADSRRTAMHDALCEAIGVSKEQTKRITDNLDRYSCFDEFYHELMELVKQKTKEE